jgi:biotin operon repressor
MTVRDNYSEKAKNIKKEIKKLRRIGLTIHNSMNSVMRRVN